MREQQTLVKGELDPLSGRPVISIALIDGDTALISYFPAEKVDQFIAILRDARTRAAILAAERADSLEHGCGCEDGACAVPHRGYNTGTV